MPFVKIKSPRQRHRGANAMIQTFAAIGTAKGQNVRSVQATLTVNGTGVPPSQIQLLRFAAQSLGSGPGRYRYSWVFLFKDVVGSGVTTPVPATLQVQGINRAGNLMAGVTDSRNFEVVFRVIAAAPTIEYPTGEDDIEGGERDYFMPFGLSDVAVTSVTLGSVTPLFTGWDPGAIFWYSVFPSLSDAPGDYLLTVTNGDGSSTRQVGIAED